MEDRVQVSDKLAMIFDHSKLKLSVAFPSFLLIPTAPNTRVNSVKYFINSQDGKNTFLEPNLYKFKIWSSLKKLH